MNLGSNYSNFYSEATQVYYIYIYNYNLRNCDGYGILSYSHQNILVPSQVNDWENL